MARDDLEDPGSASAPQRSTTPATPGTIAVHRALAILRCFEDGERTKRLSDLARTLGLSPSTTHRILSVLVADGFLAKDEDTEKYRLGRALVLLGQIGARDAQFHLVQSVLHDLTLATGESTSIAVRDGLDALVVAAVASPQRFRFDHTVGSRIALHAGGMGKVLLAFGPPLDLHARPLERYTSSTITDGVALENELETVRARSWAANHGERYDGVNGLSRPIRNADGMVVAAIGIQGPANRFTPDRENDLLNSLAEAAAALTGTLDVTLFDV